MNNLYSNNLNSGLVTSSTRYYIYSELCMMEHISRYLEHTQMKLKGVKNDDGPTLLTENKLKEQMDLWVSKGIIPNDNLLSVNMNKRVRSVGKNLFDKSSYQVV